LNIEKVLKCGRKISITVTMEIKTNLNRGNFFMEMLSIHTNKFYKSQINKTVFDMILNIK